VGSEVPRWGMSIIGSEDPRQLVDTPLFSFVFFCGVAHQITLSIFIHMPTSRSRPHRSSHNSHSSSRQTPPQSRRDSKSHILLLPFPLTIPELV